jgi:transposase-like protein
MHLEAQEVKGLKLTIGESSSNHNPDDLRVIENMKAALEGVSELYANAMQKVRVHCPKCGALLARDGHCGRCSGRK